MGVLRARRFVLQDARSREYRLGYALIALGRKAANGLPLRGYAHPVMRRLANETGETIVLTVVNESRDRAVCVERMESRHDLRFHLNVGESSYLHAGASSKVLLAWLGEDELKALVDSVGLPRLAPNTIDDSADLTLELKGIRENGHAFSQEETNEGGWGIAVPVFDDDGTVIAGLGLAAPLSRYSDSIRDHALELLVRASAELGQALGAR